MKIGFIGLGSMGTPLARLLLEAGFEVTVYNRTTAKAVDAANAGAQVADNPAAAAAGAQIVVSMLADEAAVQTILEGADGVLQHLPEGAIHIGMSTVSVAFSRHLAARHRERGQHYIAAPVFGRPDAAAAKRLWIVAAGPAEALRLAQPVLAAMGVGVSQLGEDPGLASTVKLAGNHLIAGMLQALGESFALVRKAGLSSERFLEIVNRLFKSPVYENYGRQIAGEMFTPPGFRLHLGLKDMRLVLAAADEGAVPMPLASLLHDRLLTALARGMGELDWSAVAQLAADDAGLSRRGE